MTLEEQREVVNDLNAGMITDRETVGLLLENGAAREWVLNERVNGKAYF